MLAAREQLDLPARDEWIIRGDFSLRSGYDAGEKIIGMDERPTAVFCASDQVAIGLISKFTEAGIRVPQDISVVGFDDIEQAEFNIPRLTTIRQNRTMLGHRAAGLRMAHVDDKNDDRPAEYVELLDVELIVRGSTGPVSAEV